MIASGVRVVVCWCTAAACDGAGSARSAPGGVREQARLGLGEGVGRGVTQEVAPQGILGASRVGW
jgi:hypothetical protein